MTQVNTQQPQFGELFHTFTQLYKMGPVSTRNSLIYVTLLLFVLNLAMGLVTGIASFVVMLIIEATQMEGMLATILTLMADNLSFVVLILSSFVTPLGVVLAAHCSVRLINDETVDSAQAAKDALNYTKGKILALVIPYMLVSGVAGVGFFFFIIPGIVIITVATIALLHAIEEEGTLFGSLKPAWDIYSANLTNNTLFTIANYGIVLAYTILTCCTGGSLFGYISMIAGAVVIYGTNKKSPIFAKQVIVTQ